MLTAPKPPCLRWDIFCDVIDNFGDLGVCWRLAVQLAQRGQRVRLWVSRPQPLQWMAPLGAPGVQVCPWSHPMPAPLPTDTDVLVEAFGCEIDIEFVAVSAESISARGLIHAWINLEYLSAQSYVQRCHTLPSPVQHGPAAGRNKYFFYPGFTPGTGGLLREADLLQRQANFDGAAWLRQWGIELARTHLDDKPSQPRCVSLFCYEPPALPELLHALAGSEQPTWLLVTAGRAQVATSQAIEEKKRLQPNWNKRRMLSIVYLPMLTQDDYDHLLWACDLNCVRGEDSLVRALWAGKPLLWHAYVQADAAHHAKVWAWLDWLQAPQSVRQLHTLWNAMPTPDPVSALAPLRAGPHWSAWQECIAQTRHALLGQDDLCSQLLGFVLKND